MLPSASAKSFCLSYTTSKRNNYCRLVHLQQIYSETRFRVVFISRHMPNHSAHSRAGTRASPAAVCQPGMICIITCEYDNFNIINIYRMCSGPSRSSLLTKVMIARCAALMVKAYCRSRHRDAVLPPDHRHPIRAHPAPCAAPSLGPPIKSPLQTAAVFPVQGGLAGAAYGIIAKDVASRTWATLPRFCPYGN